jgi:hypothetical protein
MAVVHVRVPLTILIRREPVLLPALRAFISSFSTFTAVSDAHKGRRSLYQLLDAISVDLWRADVQSGYRPPE